ncbi:MAG: acylphosphatase [Patescibacteria group bacterium]
MKHLNIKVTGHVQGVFYRQEAKAKAKKLCLKGVARNGADGSVLIEVEGEGTRLNQFLEWCRKGSAHSRVDKVEAHEGSVKNFNDFRIS